jgi:Ca-activated chloride channel family protein
MIDIEFLQPGVLWVVPAILVLLLAWRLRRRKRYVAFSAVKVLRTLRHRPSVVRRLPALLAGVALAFVLVALTDPVVPYSEVEIRAQGLDIVVVLDLSSSMQEMMGGAAGSSFAPATFASTTGGPRRPRGKTRLDTTKEAIHDFVTRRREDRIGLVVFSDHAYIVSPLTFDHSSLADYVDMVDDQILRGEGMTAIGDGIALANYLLSRQSTSNRQNKVIIVFTDGEHNFGRDPIDVLAESDEAGYRVHVIGVDIEEEVKQKPAVQRLISTVREYGGQYFTADTERQLRSANAALAKLEKGTLTSSAIVHNTPVFQWFAIPAILLLAAAMVVRVLPYFADVT